MTARELLAWSVAGSVSVGFIVTSIAFTILIVRQVAKTLKKDKGV